MPSQISERAFLVIREDLPACGVHIPGAPRALIRKHEALLLTQKLVFLLSSSSLERARLICVQQKNA